MSYTREEFDWIEAEWAFHLHGRQAFLSREDYLQVRAWEAEGAPADLLVNAMEAYFQRRAARQRPRAFVAMAHLARDVAKAMKLRAALLRAGPEVSSAQGWDRVREPLRSDPKGKALFDAWARLRDAAPGPDAPGYLEHFDRERAAFQAFLQQLEQLSGPAAEDLRLRLRERLAQAELEPGSAVWDRAWRHHWGRMLCQAWGVDA